jgi:hypothetical protein
MYHVFEQFFARKEGRNFEAQKEKCGLYTRAIAIAITLMSRE